LGSQWLSGDAEKAQESSGRRWHIGCLAQHHAKAEPEQTDRQEIE
jgi:hypothetical protein